MNRCAFFPSIFLLALAFTVTARDGSPGNDSPRNGSRLERAFARLDADGDERLSRAEIAAFPRVRTRLAEADAGADGAFTLREFAAAVARSMASPGDADPAAGDGFGPGDHVRTVTVDGRERRYRVHVPPGYDSGTPTPVVLAYHGGGGNAASMVRLSGLDEKADEAGFLAVYPEGAGPVSGRFLTFNGGDCCGYAMKNEIDDVAFTRALLDDLAGVANVDPGSVFATGLSNGAIMSYRVASELADRIAAIAPVGAPMATDSCDPSRPVPVVHFHGAADRFAPFEGGHGENALGGRGVTEFRSVEHTLEQWVEANGCDPDPIVEELPDRADDGTRVSRRTWSGGEGGAEVVLYRIEGGGHTWPGREPTVPMLGTATRDISANDLMWEFFQRHSREYEPGTTAGAPTAERDAPSE